MANPQTQSHLCQLPLELRWAIYEHLSPSGFHITRGRGGGLTIAECVAGDVSLDLDGRERCITGHEKQDKRWFDKMDETLAMRPMRRIGLIEPLRVRERDLPGVIWPRRLRSTWGPHWMCEEHHQAAEFIAIKSLVMLCKWMREDIMSYLVERNVVHIADLRVLQDILSTPSHEFASALDDPLSHSASRMRHLALTLRLPLAVFQFLDGMRLSELPEPELAVLQVPDSVSHEEVEALASLWSDTWLGISRMAHLQDVRVEIDHTDRSSWSIVNERKVLRPIATLKEGVPEMSVTVTLPELHPRYESRDRHFLADDGDAPPFSITRRVRQKVHAHQDIYGHWIITRSRYDTFPMIAMIMPEVLEPHEPTERDMFMRSEDYQELEQGELERWKRGEDPTEWVERTLMEWFSVDLQGDFGTI